MTTAGTPNHGGLVGKELLLENPQRQITDCLSPKIPKVKCLFRTAFGEMPETNNPEDEDLFRYCLGQLFLPSSSDV
jgi:hypothetical protein